jgi:hypothetical protein
MDPRDMDQSLCLLILLMLVATIALVASLLNVSPMLH